MKTALIFPGQGSQFAGMGKDLYEQSEAAREMFAKANEILGFDIQSIMFNGPDEELKQTSVTQPAIYIHSVILAEVLGLKPDAAMVAGHSLGEFSALAVAGAISFEDGLKLVSIRANAMQKACDAQESTMAAIVGMEDAAVEEVCKNIEAIVVPANYNSPGQLVISGSMEGVAQAIENAKENGAKMAVQLQVNGAFHSPLMESARVELEAGIQSITFNDANVPVYQNATAKAVTDKETIKSNLTAQLTAPVLWTQSVQAMIADGATKFIEVGPGKVLRGLMRRIDRSVEATNFQSLPIDQ